MRIGVFRLIPTLVVGLAIATMIALGIWQLDRADQKEALLLRYQNVSADQPAVPYPANEDAIETNLYRKTSVTCASVISRREIAGTNAVGAKGWAQYARCTLDGGGEAEIGLGWTRGPTDVDWDGGEVAGILGPGGKIVANPPLANLGPLAKPDPKDLPNNHLAYAVQWFLFALTALVIYVLATIWRARSENESRAKPSETFGG